MYPIVKMMTRLENYSWVGDTYWYIGLTVLIDDSIVGANGLFYEIKYGNSIEIGQFDPDKDGSTVVDGFNVYHATGPRQGFVYPDKPEYIDICIGDPNVQGEYYIIYRYQFE